MTSEKIAFYQKNGFVVIEDFSTPEELATWRRAMTCAYMPDGSSFNGIRNILPLDVYESLELGDVFDDDSRNRLIWHKTKPRVTARMPAGGRLAWDRRMFAKFTE